MQRIFVPAPACFMVPLAAAGQELFAHHREAIRFASGRFELAGDLLMPPGPGPHPVIVNVWGAGTSMREAHIAGSLIVGIFLEHGFAVLLCDKPGSGGSTGELDNRLAAVFPQTRDLAFAIAWSCPMESSLEQGAYHAGNYLRGEGGSAVEAAAAERACRGRGRARSYADASTPARDPGARLLPTQKPGDRCPRDSIAGPNAGQ